MNTDKHKQGTDTQRHHSTLTQGLRLVIVHHNLSHNDCRLVINELLNMSEPPAATINVCVSIILDCQTGYSRNIALHLAGVQVTIFSNICEFAFNSFIVNIISMSAQPFSKFIQATLSQQKIKDLGVFFFLWQSWQSPKKIRNQQQL